MCDKIQHNDYKSARGHQHGLLKRKGLSSRIYRCKECGYLHITTSRVNKKRH